MYLKRVIVQSGTKVPIPNLLKFHYMLHLPKIILPLVALEVEEIVTSPETEPPKIKGVVMLVVNTGESMGAKTMFPDPKIDTELMVLIFVAETKVSCLLAASPE
jgi:hypothetical protein